MGMPTSRLRQRASRLQAEGFALGGVGFEAVGVGHVGVELEFSKLVPSWMGSTVGGGLHDPCVFLGVRVFIRPMRMNAVIPVWFHLDDG